MKILSAISFVFRSVGYGALAAIVLLLLVPELRNGSAIFTNNVFTVVGNDNAPTSFAMAVNKAAPAVVNIYSESFETSPDYGKAPLARGRLGSGVIMDNRGYILTADHVIAEADQIKVLLQNGIIMPAKIIGRDSVTDLAVLQVNSQNLPVIPQNPALNTLVGDVVLAIGNPHNLGQSITQGIVSAVGRNGLSSTNYREFLQTDAAINPGNSGGALVNTHGELVGINSASFNKQSNNQDIQGIFFAVPYHLAAKIMRKLIENGRVVRGWLGITAGQLTLNDKGFYITEINVGGPADIAGLKVGDFIEEINGVAISSIPQALDMVAESSPSDTLDIKFIRNKQYMNTIAKVVEFKARR